MGDCRLPRLIAEGICCYQCSVADTGAIPTEINCQQLSKGWSESTGNHKVRQDLTTKSTHGTGQLKRCCFHRIAEGSRPKEAWADTSTSARRYLSEWTNGKEQFCCTFPIHGFYLMTGCMLLCFCSPANEDIMW